MSKKANITGLKRLSPREREVLKLLAEGHTNQEMARIVGVKSSSIYTYRSRVMNKLGTKTTAVLVRFAIRTRLIKA